LNNRFDRVCATTSTMSILCIIFHGCFR